MTTQASGRRRTRWRELVVLASVVVLAACGTDGSTGSTGPGAGASAGPAERAPRLSAAAAGAAGAARPRVPSSTPGPWTGRFHGHEVRVPRGDGAHVSLTFDDGPSPRATPQVLALLEQHDVPAVFCVVGQQARAHPELVRREAEAGHVLCDHSRDHDLSMNRRGQAYVTREVTDGLAAIEAASPGTPVPFYRQPGGTWSPQVTRAMKQSDLAPLRWDDDPRDWSRPGADAVVRRVAAQLEPGAVVLLHDGGGDRTQTVEALRWLLDALPAAGWVLVLPPQVANQ